MKNTSLWKELTKGFIRENPVFVLLLGMCPTLGVTNTAFNGLGMGLATTAVLIGSNIVIALFKSWVPDKVRIPSYIVIIASFVTVIDMNMAAYFADLHEQLGIFIPLIVVNCIVLGRAEAFASRNGLFPSIIDGLSMGLGFVFALTLLGATREFLGSGMIFGWYPFGSDMATMQIFVRPPGAVFALGLLIALINAITRKPASSRN
jgi:electron transport complex protein RnfE